MLGEPVAPMMLELKLLTMLSRPVQVRPVRASQVEMTELVLPTDTNRLGNMIGARQMHRIDIAAAITPILGMVVAGAGLDADL